MTASSLLLFTCDMALAWLMGDSNAEITEPLCYRTELGKEGGDGNFLSRINKLINI